MLASVGVGSTELSPIFTLSAVVLRALAVAGVDADDRYLVVKRG